MPVTGDIRVSDTSARAFLTGEGGPVDLYVADVAHLVGQYAREEAPVGKSADHLRDNIVVRRNRGTTWTVAARKYYARYVIQGTPPHRIPREGGGKILQFPRGNAEVFARWVHHPGTTANNFMERALERALHKD